MSKKWKLITAISMIIAGSVAATALWITADQTNATANFFFLVAVMIAMAGFTLLLIHILKTVLK